MKLMGIFIAICVALNGCDSVNDININDNDELATNPEPVHEALQQQEAVQQSEEVVVEPSPRSEKEPSPPEEPEDPADKAKLVAEELERLQGDWQQIYGKPFGRELPERVVRNNFFELYGNRKKTYKSNRRVIGSDVTVEIDPTKTPKTWDETVTTQSGKVLTYYGIYKLEGDKLTKCYAQPDHDRPKEFDSTRQNRHNLLIYQRVVPTRD